jgi:hypothetical protein
MPAYSRTIEDMAELIFIAGLVLVIGCGFIAHGPLSRPLGRIAAVAGRIGDAVDEINYAVVRQRELVLGIAEPRPDADVEQTASH